MATQPEMRNIALSMPEAIEKQHFGDPDFRVRNKIFAGLKVKDGRAWLKLGADQQTTLVTARPNVFTPAEGMWGRSGWTYVVLAEVSASELRSLVRDAWCAIAPKALVATSQLPQSRPRAKRGPRPGHSEVEVLGKTAGRRKKAPRAKS